MTLAIYYRTRDGSLFWRGGWRLEVPLQQAIQSVANATTHLPDPDPTEDDWDRAQWGAPIRPNWYRCGTKEGPLPAPNLAPIVCPGVDMLDAHVVPQ
jgi:hypothetical protein